MGHGDTARREAAEDPTYTHPVVGASEDGQERMPEELELRLGTDAQVLALASHNLDSEMNG